MTTSIASTSRVRHKRWVIAPLAPTDHLKRFPDITPLVVQILYNRGITDPDEMAAFLQADRPTATADLFRMAGMNRTVDRIRRAIKAREPIAIYGDYDVDGVTATALLVQTLAAFGANVRPYIPRRADEGYGLNVEALQALKNDGVRLVITVDCGVRSLSEVAFAKAIGLDLIVSDHHMPLEDLPDAYALINPKQPDCPYPFKELAGVGLAFKIAQALLLVNARTDDTRVDLLTEDDLLDLVALGTVADLAPLLGENRLLVARGLQQLRRTRRPGLRALLNVSGSKTIDTSTIGFALGPRLNAAGRLDHALNAYDLLMTQDPAASDRIALELDSRNRERQVLTRDLFEKAREIVMAHTDGTALLVRRRSVVQFRRRRAGGQPPHRRVLSSLGGHRTRAARKPRLLPQHSRISHHAGAGRMPRVVCAPRRARRRRRVHHRDRQAGPAGATPLRHRRA